MSGGPFDPLLYPVAGVHAAAGDGDQRSLVEHHTAAIEAVGKMLETALVVRDQHRTQLDALREHCRSLTMSLRSRDEEIERLQARIRELEASEAADNPKEETPP